jgi:hypothetical protein
VTVPSNGARTAHFACNRLDKIFIEAGLAARSPVGELGTVGDRRRERPAVWRQLAQPFHKAEPVEARLEIAEDQIRADVAKQFQSLPLIVRGVHSNPGDPDQAHNSLVNDLVIPYDEDTHMGPFLPGPRFPHAKTPLGGQSKQRPACDSYAGSTRGGSLSRRSLALRPWRPFGGSRAGRP